MRFLIRILFIFIACVSFAQGDRINQRDKDGLKHGRWIYYGVDLPQYDYPDSVVFKEGKYFHGRKEGIWTKYDRDGTILRQEKFKNHFPVTLDGQRIRRTPFYSSCEKCIYDSIVVRYRSVNSYVPIIDTSITFYQDSGKLADYVDSLSTLDTAFQSKQRGISSHFTDITITKYVGATYCKTLFSSNSGNFSKPIEVARECAYKVFGIGKLED